MLMCLMVRMATIINMVVGPDNDDLDGGDGIDNCDGGLVLTKTLMVIVKTRLITRPRK